MTKRIIFVTGNQNKLEEAKKILPTYDIVNEKIDLDEYQGTPVEIATKKIEHAFEILNKPCFIEDTSLSFNALGGMPGPYIKDFVTNLGVKDIPKLLDSFDDKTSIARTIVGYHDGNNTHIFVGETSGEIKEHCGIQKFGWDPIFYPNDCNVAYSQMTKEEKNKISQRSKAFKKFKEFLESN